MTSEVISVIGAVLAGVAGVLTGVAEYVWAQKRKAKAPALEDRIKTLAKDLEAASASISEIEREIFRRREMAEKLKEDVRYYEQLKALNGAQVEAIASTLRAEMGRSQRRSLYISAVITFFVAFAFFMLGLRFGGG